MNETDNAAKIVIELTDELEVLNGRAVVLAKERQELSYSARTGDKNAKARLDKINVEATTLTNDIEIVAAALVEAKLRLGSAEQVAALEADRAKAVKIQELQAAFVERLLAIHDACGDIAKCTTENKLLLSEIHRLGVTVPSHDLVRINSVLALKTMLMATPWNPNEFADFPHFLAPHERKLFRDLAVSWGATISNQIADRLPNKEAA
jgi:hypothetical protein